MSKLKATLELRGSTMSGYTLCRRQLQVLRRGQFETVCPAGKSSDHETRAQACLVHVVEIAVVKIVVHRLGRGLKAHKHFAVAARGIDLTELTAVVVRGAAIVSE